jgi:hypothetical protein
MSRTEERVTVVNVPFFNTSTDTEQISHTNTSHQQYPYKDQTQTYTPMVVNHFIEKQTYAYKRVIHFRSMPETVWRYS